jgi:hypothetical protein
MDRSL